MLLEKFKKSFVFKRFLISYVSILLIPLLLSLIVFNTSFTVVQKNSVNSTLFLLNQLKNFIDSKMEKIDEIAIKMAYDSKTSVDFNIGYAPKKAHQMFTGFGSITITSVKLFLI